MHARRALSVVLVGLVLACAPARAQVVLTGGGTYTQNFDTLPNDGPPVPWVQNTTLPGWYADRSGSGSDLAVGDGTLSTINLYSFGTVTSSDRALGSIGGVIGAANAFAWGVVFRNVGTQPLNITISYFGEQWRSSAVTQAQQIIFTYAQSSTPITETAFDAEQLGGGGDIFSTYGSPPNFPLNFVSPEFSGSARGLNGNAERQERTSDFTAGSGGVQLDPGEYIAFRWYDADHSSTDHGLATDDLTITFTPVPEPGTVLAVAAAGLGLTGAARRRLVRRTA